MTLHLLDEQIIRRYLAHHPLQDSIHFHLHSSISSTNQFLKDLPASSTLEICCAESQTHGRGRFGRSWYSPFAENIYFSSRWHFENQSQLAGLSLVVSLAILATLNDFSLHEGIRIKWPNDLLWHDKKLCGTLIEIITESPLTVIIGIGLNVNSKQDQKNHSDLPQKPWCSLWDMSEQSYNRNIILARLIIQLHTHIQALKQEGLTHFTSRWCDVDYLKGKEITIYQSHQTLTGIAQGIDRSGRLILSDQHGKVHYLSSGETSLKENRAKQD